MFIRPAVLLVLGASMSVHAALDLKPRSPNEPADYTFNERFSANSALERTQQVVSIFESFRKLTEMSERKVGAKALRDIGNTESDMQGIGFANIPSILEGTILKQEYLIKKLEYELAVERSKSSKVAPAVLASLQKESERAEGAFQQFWNKLELAD